MGGIDVGPAERSSYTGSSFSPGEDRMPLTVKLSRRFYEALGDDVTNELVECLDAVDLSYGMSFGS